MAIYGVLLCWVSLLFECCAECRYDEWRYAECRYDEWRYAECRYDEWRYAECIMLNVVILSVVAP